MGIELERHASYRLLIAQAIWEMRRMLVNGSTTHSAATDVKRLEQACDAVVALADATLPLAKASAEHFVDFDQHNFWARFDAALEACGEFDRYPAGIRQQRRDKKAGRSRAS